MQRIQPRRQVGKVKRKSLGKELELVVSEVTSLGRTAYSDPDAARYRFGLAASSEETSNLGAASNNQGLGEKFYSVAGLGIDLIDCFDGSKRRGGQMG